MAIETLISFAAASAIMLMIPGPTVLLVVSYALGQGWRAAAPMAVGVALGDFTAMTLSMLGVGALLAASAAAFTAVKWIGAAYLIWLGVKLWRAGGTAAGAEPRRASGARRMMLHAWLVTTLNPKSIVFFVAFLPQFVDPAAPLTPQLLAFQAIFLCLALLNAFGYALLAARARRSVASPRMMRIAHRVGGGALIGAGVASAGLRASA
jgi:threonine/homoserine/homoserine lactone efflux protein